MAGETPRVQSDDMSGPEPLPERIGRYKIERKIGEGGMGVVWAAFDPDLERPVAIKVLRSIDSVATLRTRLLREARAMARLKHPNVLTVYEVGTDRNRDYIAMELIDGSDLDAWLATAPPRMTSVSSIATSSRTTSCADATARCTSPTSASHAGRSRKARSSSPSNCRRSIC